MCFMSQTQRKIIQGAYSAILEEYIYGIRMIGDLTYVAKAMASCRDTLAVAVIYRTSVITRPGKGRTFWDRGFTFPLEAEVAVLNVESREADCFVALEVLRNASRAFIGMRELQIPLLRDAAGCLVGSDGIQLPHQESLRKTGFGLRHPDARAAEAPEEEPKDKRVRRRSGRKLPNFEIREFPFPP